MLFSHAGKKIRILAIVLFWIELGFAALFGMGCMLGGLIEEEFAYIVAGLFALPIGFVVAYLTNLFLIAFGELVESTTRNKEINEEILNKLNAAPVAPATSVAPVESKWFCTSCGAQNPAGDLFCTNCGKRK